MPTYTVFAQTGRLSQAQKSRVAAEITRVHNEQTGAQTFFAQVIFQDVPQGNHFVGGAPLAADHLFVHGQIRAGRSAATKRLLLEHMLDAVCAAAATEKVSTWIYIVDLPPAQMAEYGHILPEPGTEAAWLAGLPEADRVMMESTGKAQ
jgi:phenylpyruvate tautomerase PptA (4-oxalocrotonate tautomerase family)